MERAAQRAMAKPLRVKMTGFRSYEVINGDGERYCVVFEKRGERKLAERSCTAGMQGMLCYHAEAFDVTAIREPVAEDLPSADIIIRPANPQPRFPHLYNGCSDR